MFTSEFAVRRVVLLMFSIIARAAFDGVPLLKDPKLGSQMVPFRGSLTSQ